MKNKNHILFLIVLLMLILTGCGEKREPEECGKDVTEEMNLSFERDDITKVKEIHFDYSGVPYEGVAYYEMELDEAATEEALKWESLPLSKEAEEFGNSLVYFITMPEVTEGTFMFLDEHPDDDSSINSKLVIYDSNKKVLYYIKADT